MMMIARTAAHLGAIVASSARVTGFARTAGRITGATVTDLETGAEIEVRAEHVINGTGVRVDEIQELIGGRGQFRVRASKGIHLVVPRERISWGNFWFIGTTDTDWNLDPRTPRRARPTSTTSSASTPGCSPCSPGRTSRPRSCRASTPSPRPRGA